MWSGHCICTDAYSYTCMGVYVYGPLSQGFGLVCGVTRALWPRQSDLPRDTSESSATRDAFCASDSAMTICKQPKAVLAAPDEEPVPKITPGKFEIY